MSYVKTINEDGVVSDIMAKALDPTLDATVLHKSELVNGFTQTTAGQNALDAAAGKSLNDSLANNLQTQISKVSRANMSNKTFEFTVPSSSRHFVMAMSGYFEAQWVGVVFGGVSGNVSVREIAKGTQITSVTTGQNSFTIQSSTTQNLDLIDILISGGTIS